MKKGCLWCLYHKMDHQFFPFFVNPFSSVWEKFSPGVFLAVIPREKLVQKNINHRTLLVSSLTNIAHITLHDEISADMNWLTSMHNHSTSLYQCSLLFTFNSHANLFELNATQFFLPLVELQSFSSSSNIYTPDAFERVADFKYYRQMFTKFPYSRRITVLFSKFWVCKMIAV